jgi:hypothetical protein
MCTHRSKEKNGRRLITRQSIIHPTSKVGGGGGSGSGDDDGDDNDDNDNNEPSLQSSSMMTTWPANLYS